MESLDFLNVFRTIHSKRENKLSCNKMFGSLTKTVHIWLGDNHINREESFVLRRERILRMQPDGFFLDLKQ